MKSMKILMLTMCVVVAVAAQAQVANKKSLTLDGAKRVVAAAVAEAKRLNAPGAAIAVVDDGGNLMVVERLDNTFAAGANISIGKARTAAIFKRPTSLFEKIIRDGRTPMVALNDFTPLQGGVPIEVDGQVVGAIGVSGAASAQQDEELAIAGANVLKSSTGAMMEGVTYLKGDKVAEAFKKGMPLLENGKYKVHASHRDRAGLAEVHTRDTDIIYVLEGTATLVTGGTVVEGKEIAPDEIRGASISNGETRKLGSGDVVVVPNGTPHWFKEASSPFNYYVVKVTE
jgi:glc operon protein GlcG